MENDIRRKIGLLITVGALFTALFILVQSMYFPSTDESGGLASTLYGKITGQNRADENTIVSQTGAIGADLEVVDTPGTAGPPGPPPSRLVIPKIGVDAKVQHLGITRSGNMAVPSNFTDVGWYKNGPTPGSHGSSVIAGHVDNAMGMDAVFKKLENLSPGDDIYVVRSDGKRLRFQVIGSKIHPYNLRGSELNKIFSDTSGTYLNLITCAGRWLPSARTNDKRLVVYTKLVSS